MDETNVFAKMSAIASALPAVSAFEPSKTLEEKVSQYKVWLNSIPHERPKTNHAYKVGIYIRYFNQTKHENYIDYHTKQYTDTLALCPQWEFVGFYIDSGASAPNMENAPEWSRLLNDCFAGKVNLIITQKVSNVSKRPFEISFCSRILAAQTPPIGIYFISEDMFTLASYFQKDLRDTFFLPSRDSVISPDDEDMRGKLHD